MAQRAPPNTPTPGVWRAQAAVLLDERQDSSAPSGSEIGGTDPGELWRRKADLPGSPLFGAGHGEQATGSDRMSERLSPHAHSLTVEAVDFSFRTAGRSAEAKYKALAKGWHRRAFGGRAPIYFWGLFALALSPRVDGASGVQVAARRLGERKTASELRRLRRDGWIVRHDLAWGSRANNDQVSLGRPSTSSIRRTCLRATSPSMAKPFA